MSVRAALALINQTLTEVLSEQEDEFDADTRWAMPGTSSTASRRGTLATPSYCPRRR